MLSRRNALQFGLATLGPYPLPNWACAQSRATVKVRYNEVIRSVMYAPSYVAIGKGLFQDAGLDVSITTAQGGDKSIAALVGGTADIALMGPESAIYVLGSESPTKVRIFCGLTATDGFMLVGREKVSAFDWSILKGADLLGFRPGSTPLLYFEAAMRKNGLDPLKDVRLTNNIGIPARVGSWLAGQFQFAIFPEPDASQLEIDGKAHFLASVGETVGAVDYTAFMATDDYINNNTETLQKWTAAIAKAQRWTATAPLEELVTTLMPFFPNIAAPVLTAAADRYRRLKIWKATPVIEPSAIAAFQDILVAGDVLKLAKRVTYDQLVRPEFANKAR